MGIIEFDPIRIGAMVAAATVLTQLVKTVFERIEGWQAAPAWVRRVSSWWAHSRGPVIISILIPLFMETLPGIIEDGSLSMIELATILNALGIGALANIVYWISRRKSPIGRRLPFRR